MPHDYTFMINYPPGPDRAWVARLHGDLERRLSSRLNAPVRGYLRHPSTGGDTDGSGLRVAAQTSVMVVLYSDEFFASRQCLHEWMIFSVRESDEERRTGLRRSSMVGVLWKAVEGTVPTSIARSTSWRSANSARSGMAGVRVVQSRGAAYDDMVASLANAVLAAKAHAPERMSPDEATLVPPVPPIETTDKRPLPDNPDNSVGNDHGSTAANHLWVAESWQERRYLADATDNRLVHVDLPATELLRPDEPVAEYAFFTSHASKLFDKPFVYKFHNDLQNELGVQMRRDAIRPGFLAPRDIEAGANWRDALCRAACTTPVMIALLCEDLFASGWCGWEWSVFTTRAKGVDATQHPRQISILPVTWLRFDPADARVPAPVLRLQQATVGPIGLERTTERTSLVNLMRRNPSQYDDFVIDFAERILEATARQLPHISEHDARRLPQAFGTFADGGPLAIDA